MKALEEMKEEFLAIYRENVKRDGADALLKWLLESDFFEAPASTRFHGSHEGGLVMHSLNVYHSLCDLVEHAGLQDVYSAESIAISALLHDVCKVNFYKKGTRNVKDEETGQWYKKDVYEIDEKFPCRRTCGQVNYHRTELYPSGARRDFGDSGAHGRMGYRSQGWQWFCR